MAVSTPRVVLCALLLRVAAAVWRHVPALRAHVHPAPPTLAAFSASLASRGYAPSTVGAALRPELALAAHVPHSHALNHSAVHEGVGFVHVDYDAVLAARTVHLDEFAALFAERGATFECGASTANGDSWSTPTTLTFTPPARAGHDPAAAAHVAHYLAARLRTRGAMLTWGPAVLQLAGANAALFAPSCDAAFERSAHFLVTHASATMGEGPTSIAAIHMTLSAAPPATLFASLKLNFRIDPDAARARRLLVEDVPTFDASGALVEDAAASDGGAGGARDLAAVPRPFMQNGKPPPMYTARASVMEWNYKRPGVATNPAVPFFGGRGVCKHCYARISVAVVGVIDWRAPVGGICKPCCLCEVGSYFEGDVDVRGTYDVKSNGKSEESVVTQLMKPRELYAGTVLAAGITIPVKAALSVDLVVYKMSAFVGSVTLNAAYTMTTTQGFVYNYFRPAGAPFIQPVSSTTSKSSAGSVVETEAAYSSLSIALMPTVTLDLWAGTYIATAKVVPYLALLTYDDPKVCSPLTVLELLAGVELPVAACSLVAGVDVIKILPRVTTADLFTILDSTWLQWFVPPIELDAASETVQAVVPEFQVFGAPKCMIMSSLLGIAAAQAQRPVGGRLPALGSVVLSANSAGGAAAALSWAAALAAGAAVTVLTLGAS